MLDDIVMPNLTSLAHSEPWMARKVQPSIAVPVSEVFSRASSPVLSAFHARNIVTQLENRTKVLTHVRASGRRGWPGGGHRPPAPRRTRYPPMSVVKSIVSATMTITMAMRPFETALLDEGDINDGEQREQHHDTDEPNEHLAVFAHESTLSTSMVSKTMGMYRYVAISSLRARCGVAASASAMPCQRTIPPRIKAAVA